MEFLGRFIFRALCFFFILAALNCNVALGLPTKAADGNADFASVALRPGSPAAAGASVAVAADGSLLVRPIMTDGFLEGRAVDVITRADSTETSESMVRRIDESLVDDGTTGVSGYSEFEKSNTSSVTSSLYIGIVVLAILLVCECGILVGLGRKAPSEPLLAPTKAEEPGVRPSQQRQSMAGSDPEQPKGKGKGLDKGAPLKDEDDEGKGKALHGYLATKGKGKEANQSSDGTPPTNEITAKGGASKGGAKGMAGASSPPESTEAAAPAPDIPTVVEWAVPCSDYRRNILTQTLGMCKCGHLKDDHEQFK